MPGGAVSASDSAIPGDICQQGRAKVQVQWTVRKWVPSPGPFMYSALRRQRNTLKVHFYTIMWNLNPAFMFVHGTSGRRVKVVETQLPILIVEDEVSMQQVVADALQDAGFEVAIASSAEEAVVLLKSQAASYRALVTDINLKGRMNGWAVAKQAREIDPTFPIVYMTGAAGGEWASHGVPNSILLEKPFAPAQLVTAVAQLLNSAAPTG